MIPQLNAGAPALGTLRLLKVRVASGEWHWAIGLDPFLTPLIAMPPSHER